MNPREIEKRKKWAKIGSGILAKIEAQQRTELKTVRTKSPKERLIALLKAEKPHRQGPKLNLEITLATASDSTPDVLEVLTDASAPEIGDEVRLNGKVPDDDGYTDQYGTVYTVEDGIIVDIKEVDSDPGLSIQQAVLLELKKRDLGIPPKPKGRHRSDDPVKDSLFAMLDARNRELKKKASKITFGLR